MPKTIPHLRHEQSTLAHGLLDESHASIQLAPPSDPQSSGFTNTPPLTTAPGAPSEDTFTMQLVHAPFAGEIIESSPTVLIAAERRQLAKRLWRATAADGTEFGFELAAPLAHGDIVHATNFARYIIAQTPEPVLEIPLPQAADAAAVTGWAVGNLHFPIEAQPTRLLAPDDIALRQSLERLGIAYRAIDEVFRPHRLAAAAAPHSHAAGPEAHPFVFKPVAPHA